MPAPLESILSGEATASPAVETRPQPTPDPSPPDTQATQEQDAPEPAEENGQVPVAALRAERAKAKRYTEQIAEFNQRFEEQNRQWESRFGQLLQVMKPQTPEQAPPPAPEIWDKPDEFVAHRAAQVVDPVNQRTMALAREVATLRYKPEVVEAAEKAFNAAAASGQMDRETHARINQSANPFAAAVEWYQRTSLLSEIGDDPAAFKAKVEAEAEARILEKYGIRQNAPAPMAPASVMPSDFTQTRNVGSRSGPAWSGPAPLNDIFARRK